MKGVNFEKIAHKVALVRKIGGLHRKNHAMRRVIHTIKTLTHFEWARYFYALDGNATVQTSH